MPKRKIGEEEEFETKFSNIKCGLKSKCNNELVFNKIQKDVEEISSLSVECSRYIHYSLMKKWENGIFEDIKFNDYYYHLFENKLSKYELEPNYRDIRNKFHLKLYDKCYKSNLIIDAANRYSTLFHNNFWMHGYRRIRNFLNRFDKNTYDTMHFLFNAISDRIPNPKLIEALREHLHWNGEKFYNLINKKTYFEHIKFFYKLQRYNEENNLKNFNLIPILKFGRHHVRYDSFALWQLLRSINLCTGPWKNFDQNLEWRKHFKILETKNKHFENSMMTDGVAISFLMGKNEKKEIKSKKTKKQNNEEYVFGNIGKIKENINLYDTKIGLDPGLKLIVAGVKNDKPIKIKSSRFRQMTGVNTRNFKLKKWTTNLPNTTISPMSKNFEQYTKYQLSIFNCTQNEFMQRKVARLKFQKYICVEKAAFKLAKEIIGDVKKQKTLVVIGSTKIAGNSPMRGYIRTPQPKILKALNTYSDVLEIGEFRTTKLCANCHNEHITSLSPHRYQFCQKCGITWNRDVNAGKNLLYLGLCKIHDIEKHENFKKNTILNTTKKKTANVKSIIGDKNKAETTGVTTVGITQSTSGTRKAATTTRTRVTDDTAGSSSTINDDSKTIKLTTAADQMKKQSSKTLSALVTTTSTKFGIENPSSILKTSDVKSKIGEKCKTATTGATTVGVTQSTTTTSGTIKPATTTHTRVTTRPYNKLSLTKRKM